MGARVSVISSSGWKSAKPADYKNSDLDKAIAAFDKVKKLKLPYQVIDKLPTAKLSEFDGCINALKTSLTAYESAKQSLNAAITAAKAVQTAGAKVSADLKKLSKGKDVDESAYTAAASEADNQASGAANEVSNLSA